MAMMESTPTARQKSPGGDACFLLIQATDNKVGRRAYQSADTAHAGSVTERDKQFGGRDTELLRPHPDNIDKECNNGGVAQEGTERGDRQHKAHDGFGVCVRDAEQVLYNPLQHACVRESGNDNKQHTNDSNGGGADAGKGFFGIKNARDIEYADCRHEDHIRTQFGEQKDGEHRKDGEDSNPRVQSEAKKTESIHCYSHICEKACKVTETAAHTQMYA